MASLEGGIADPAVKSRWAEFIWVKVTDGKTVKELGGQGAGRVIAFDPNMNSIATGSAMSGAALLKVMDSANAAYADAEPKWEGSLEAATEAAKKGDKPLAIWVYDKKPPSDKLLKLISNRYLVSEHPKFVWFKSEFEKNSELCKLFKVSSGPVLLIVDPREPDAKGALDKIGSASLVIELYMKLEKDLKAYEERIKKKK